MNDMMKQGIMYKYHRENAWHGAYKGKNGLGGSQPCRYLSMSRNYLHN